MAELGSTIARLGIAWINSRLDLDRRALASLLLPLEQTQKEFRTFRVNLGRQAGHSYAIAQLARQLSQAFILVRTRQEITRFVKERHLPEERILLERDPEELAGRISKDGILLCDQASLFKSSEKDLREVVPQGFLMLFG